MKRAAQSFPISSDDSSDSDSDDNTSIKHGGKTQLPQSSKDFMSEAIAKKKKPGGMDYEALSRHGYRGGPSVLKVPPPRVEEKEQDWSWSTGRENNAKGNTTEEESYEDRERTRAALAQAEEKLIGVQANSQASKTDKKNLSFSQKEKRKRDLGQASRGKNYVEEEKRLLRDSGVYSGFDS